MSNLLAVEQDPQEQPAECSWGSGDRGVNSFFLRVTNPDQDTRTLLIGEIFFKHLAKSVGYVHRTEVEEEHNRLSQELSDVRDTLNRLGTSLDRAVSSVGALDELKETVQRLSDVVGSFDQLPDDDEERTDRDDESAEDDDESEGSDSPSVLSLPGKQPEAVEQPSGSSKNS